MTHCAVQLIHNCDTNVDVPTEYIEPVFEPIGDETTAKIEDSIKDAIAQWLPHVVLNRVDVNVDQQTSNQINVDLEFGVTIEPEALETIQLVFVSQF